MSNSTRPRAARTGALSGRTADLLPLMRPSVDHASRALRSDPEPAAGPGRARASARTPLFGVVLFVGLFAVQMTVLLRLSPRLFWPDDAMTQYSPAYWWLGRHQAGLVPPLMNPELGGASSFATDMQYGVFDPLHWLWQALAAQFSDMAAYSAIFGCVCLFVVGSGVLVQLLLRRVPPVLAASVAVGVSSSGFLLWFGSTWWTLMWSAGFVCWVWNGLSMRSWAGPLVLGGAVAALFTAGYPYFLPFAVLLVLAHLAESAFAARSARVLLDRRRLLQYAAIAGGLCYAVPTLATMLQAAPFTWRPEVDPVLGNSGIGVANFLDILLGSPTLMADTSFPLPGSRTVTYTFLVTAPLVPLIRWERFSRVPGAFTGLVVAGAAIVATQLPAVVFGLRHPVLYSSMIAIFLPITLVLLVIRARRITRRRVVLAFLIVLAQVLLAVARAPHFAAWQAVSLLLLSSALLAVLVLLFSSVPSRRRVAAAAVSLMSIAPCLLTMGFLMWLQNAAEQVGYVTQYPAAAAQPYRPEPGWSISPATVSTFAENSIAPNSSASVYDFRELDIDQMFATGAFAGNQNLFANASLGYGYTPAVSQVVRRTIECRGRWDSLCWAQGLLNPAAAPAPAGERWIDVLSQRVVFVNADAPQNVVDYLSNNWDQTLSPDGWLRFVKRDPLPGRITVADDVQVATTGWSTGLGRVGSPMEHYSVSTGSRPGTLAFYTTFWPGLKATVDGRPVAVSAMAGSLLEVALPPGLHDARLEISYAPIGSKILPLLIIGPCLVLVAAITALVLGRRGSRPSAAVLVRNRTGGHGAE